MLKNGKGGRNTKTGLVQKSKVQGCFDYIISMCCEYIPLTKLGLPVPPNNEEE